MNREIKFRGKCAKSGDWVYGDLIHGVGIKDGTIYILPRRVNLAYVKHCDPLDGVKVHPETVGQYTGLKDKEGNEIYEDDIVYSEDHNPPKYIIKFIEGGFCGIAKGIEDYPIDINHFYPSIGCVIKIVDNIHDNPELIK